MNRARAKDRSKAGYTLIELVVTIGIVVLLAAVAVPSLTGNRSLDQLQNSTMEIQSLLRRARSLAVAPPPDNDSFQYYGVEFSSQDPLEYSLARRKDSPLVVESYPAGSLDVKNKDKVKLLSSTPANLRYIWFKIDNYPQVYYQLNGENVLSQPAKGEDMVVTFVDKVKNEQRTLKIKYKSGVVDAQK